MPLAIVVLSCGLCLLAAYIFYGSFLSRVFRLNPEARTPAVELQDNVDYVPIHSRFLMGQHFSAIAAAGPIVGPILAGLMFGWAPALLWIILGCVFIGGVHDMGALVASIRHKARSIADVVLEHMTRRSYILFLIFVWIALVYVIVSFTDIVAGSFVGTQVLENGVAVSGGGIATSSLLYLLLAVIMGLVLRYAKLSLGSATAIFLPIIAIVIWGGQRAPINLPEILGVTDAQGHKIWDVIILGYCFAASLVPMWMLLQPRGHLGGYFLFFALVAGILGVLFGGKTVQYPAFTGWAWTSAGGASSPLFPVLFVTIACGACSGFHALVASGTTSKQLSNEADSKPVGYGMMLLEGMVAVVSLCCVMMLPREAALGFMKKPNYLYAQGMGSFLQVARIPISFGISFGLLAFTTFVYDTLDVSARLGRYVVQELTGWRGKAGRCVATAVTAGVPLFLVMQEAKDAAGNPVPAWSIFWPLFGASNQLLAALTLIGVTVWLHRTRRAKWVWLVTGLPTLFMYAMSTWALLRFIRDGFFDSKWNFKGFRFDPVAWIAVVLVGLALLLLIEAVNVVRRTRAPAS